MQLFVLLVVNKTKNNNNKKKKVFVGVWIREQQAVFQHGDSYLPAAWDILLSLSPEMPGLS